jgi:tetratricopeptide (TPR) repeat protein
MMQGRVFLSAVSSEFDQARDRLAADLRARGAFVSVQSDFRSEQADTLLGKLHDYIRDCAQVVCVVGTRSGACPTMKEAEPFRHVLPADVTEASYTQWEFFLARHFRCHLSVHIAAASVRPERHDPIGPDRPDLQRAFRDHLVAEGIDRTEFATLDQLRVEVLKLDPVRGPKLIALPYPSLGTLFKGRDGFLRRLRASLTRADGRTAAIAGRAVHGLGGVGKTRAAVEYAWAHRAEYTALALLDAETGEKLHAGLAALVGPLRLPEREALEEEARKEAALAWLNTNPGWLLILDNIDIDGALDATNRLLGRLQGGHVVLTSRLARFPRGVERLDLDVLDPDDAAAFLLEATEGGRRKAADDAAQARVLAEELGQLALALEMAAATIEARGLGFAAYRALWQGNRARVVGWAGQKITGYHHAVAETWRTSVDQLSEAGRHLLERLAFLAPDPVPAFLLDVVVPGAEAEDAAAALDDLAAYSLVTRDVETGTFQVHRLVQDVTRRGLEVAGTTTARLTEALGWVDNAFVGHPQDVRSWSRLDPLAPHAEAMARYADEAGIIEPTARLISRLGLLFLTKALYTRADPLMRRALTITEARFGKDDPNVAAALNNLAVLLQGTNRLAEAEPLLLRTLAIYEANLGKDHPSVATALNDLADLLQETNRIREAEPLLRRALSIYEASLGKDHPSVATALNNLALLLRDTSRLDEAALMLRRALAIDEASYGKDHPNVASRLNNLSQVLQTSKRFGEAETLIRRALAITEASLGKDHPNVATVLNNLATLLLLTNRVGEAEQLMRRTLAIDEASFGKDHPDVARDLNNLSRLLHDTNRLGEAEAPMRRALIIFFDFEHSNGHAHPSRDAAVGNYTHLLAATGKSKAEIAATIAALRREAGLGPT